jgi:hypothetical protein
LSFAGFRRDPARTVAPLEPVRSSGIGSGLGQQQRSAMAFGMCTRNIAALFAAFFGIANPPDGLFVMIVLAVPLAAIVAVVADVCSPGRSRQGFRNRALAWGDPVRHSGWARPQSLLFCRHLLLPEERTRTVCDPSMRASEENNLRAAHSAKQVPVRFVDASSRITDVPIDLRKNPMNFVDCRESSLTHASFSAKLGHFAKSLSVGAVLLGLLGSAALAQEWTPDKGQLVEPPKPYSPFVDQHFPQQVLFGDTHFHSSLSVDSGLVGNTLDLETAIRFARGEEVRTNGGQRAKLIRPLDFLVLSDHAEYLGIADLLNKADPALLATPVGKGWYEAKQKGGDAAWTVVQAMLDDFGSGNPKYKDAKVERSVWDGVVDTASKYNEPGAFSVLNGYEYSSTTNGDNLHRVVVFRDGPDRVKQVLPYSAFDSQDPEKLWAYMADYEKNTGGSVLAIPHNSNLSNGAMFAETVNGQPMTADYAKRRAQWEPLMEATQEKGDSETHPVLSPDDEFADFETWDTVNTRGIPNTPDMYQYEYARSALKLGLRLEGELGANPFKFGMIGSSDTHTSLTTTREDNYFGKLPNEEPSAERFKEVFLRDREKKPVLFAWQLGASGMIAVWARENTREEIFDAMRRKEVFATSGSRIRVRVFAGWDFEADEVERPDFARTGYARGVPMGGDLTNGPDGKAPRFMIVALRDPDNANLDRAQVIKGWLDDNGETHERIWDVACSDGRAIKNRRCEKPVGSTVDIADASYTNTIGDPLLAAHWVDPDFDPAHRAFYYVRVIEIPKPRWTAYDAKFFNVKMPKEVPMTVQDRAYTSPIWYTP